MRKTITITKGLNLALNGSLPQGAAGHAAAVAPARAAVIPDDFPGFTPKPEVAEGDLVAAGAPLLRSKEHPSMKLVSPISGKVTAIVRGARRKIERIVVETLPDAPAPVTLKVDTADTASVETAIMQAGLWAMMRQRPYDIVPAPGIRPRDIFVTAMDTAPLALSLEEQVKGREADIRAGVAALAWFTDGTIYISVEAGSRFPDIEGAEIVEFNPLHPAGNAGVQAANIRPVNKGEVIWTLDIVTLARIGRLMLTGEVDTTAMVAVTGPEVIEPKVVKTSIGAEIGAITDGDIADDGVHHRIISGNVLTGTPEGRDGFLRYPYRQVTVIREGDDNDEFMGWASMSPSKMSVSRSFPGRFFGRLFSPDARLNGGRRAMIMSEVYDRFFPMDILPEYLVKAIKARDIDQMEALGIYEVAPEDFALAEYADPSKIELQKLVRDGLDYLRAEV